MNATSTPAIRVPLPPPVRTAGSFGPFPSARDALKFAAYAAVGAVVAGWTTALAWLPFLVVGYFVAVYRLDGKPLDDRLRDLAEFGWRRRTGGRHSAASADVGPGGIARVDGRYWVSVIETGGVPVAFLPPAELRLLFDEYRSLLRSLDPGVAIWMEGEPFSAGEFAPGSASFGGPESIARTGYGEMVSALCRKRYRRRVRILLWEARPEDSAVHHLDDRVSAVVGALSRLGLSARRLRADRLVRFLRGAGWDVAALKP